MTLAKPTQYKIIMNTFDSHYAVEIKELIFSVYNNNKPINGQKDMFLMAVKN